MKIKIKNETIKKLSRKLLLMAFIIFLLIANTSTFVCAATSTESIDSFINFACDWLVKIGGIIALIGGVMFALGWQREDAERKKSWADDSYGWIYVGSNRTVKIPIRIVERRIIVGWNY